MRGKKQRCCLIGADFYEPSGAMRTAFEAHLVVQECWGWGARVPGGVNGEGSSHESRSTHLLGFCFCVNNVDCARVRSDAREKGEEEKDGGEWRIFSCRLCGVCSGTPPSLPRSPSTHGSITYRSYGVVESEDQRIISHTSHMRCNALPLGISCLALFIATALQINPPSFDWSPRQTARTVTESSTEPPC